MVDKTSPTHDAARSGLRRMPAGPMLDASAVQAADVRDLTNPQVTRFYTVGARPAAPWGRGGLARGPGNSVYLGNQQRPLRSRRRRFQRKHPAARAAGDAADGQLHPTNYAHNLARDLSGSASPVVFNFAGKTLIAASQKESVLRILDATRWAVPTIRPRSVLRRAWAMTRRPAPIRGAACGARSPPISIRAGPPLPLCADEWRTFDPVAHLPRTATARRPTDG